MQPVLAELTLTATIGIAIAAFLIGGFAGVILIRLLTGGTIRAARRDAENLRQKAIAEDEAAQRKAELEIERMLVERREALEHELDDARQQIKKDQGRLQNREDTLDRKMEQLSNRESKLDTRDSRISDRESELDGREKELDESRSQAVKRLSEISQLSIDDARA